MLKRLVVGAVTTVLVFHLNASLLFAAEGGPGAIESWVTTPDRLTLFAKQSDTIRFRPGRGGRGATIVVDSRQAYQTMDGFGFALTGGSAELLVKMSPDARGQLLFELFATDLGGIGVSYLRLTIGSSDLNSFVFSYDDLPEGQTDPEMK
ncbi:MAG: glucosylceramidase, partial [Phycisphaerales bacterium]